MKQCMIRSTIPTRGWKSALFGAVAFTTPSVFAQVPMAGVEVVNAWREGGASAPNHDVANAAAPRWISEHSLGRPLDENFEPIPGPDGAPLFDLAHRVSQRSHNETTHEQTVLDTLTGLRGQRQLPRSRQRTNLDSVGPAVRPLLCGATGAGLRARRPGARANASAACSLVCLAHLLRAGLLRGGAGFVEQVRCRSA
jgi:hypothetical protein